jgi:Ran GTPase-activating protein (RanGAP) involved in mRNA processing and transport
MDIIDTRDFQRHGISCVTFLTDFKEKENIKIINLSGIFLQTSDIFSLFYKIFPSYPLLSCVKMSNTSIFDNDMEILFHEMYRTLRLETLDLSHNLIQGHTLKIVNHLVPDYVYLKNLYLDNNELDCRGLVNLSQIFRCLVFLEKLSISNNYVKDFGFQSFAMQIHSLLQLKYLDISYNKCSKDTLLLILQNIPVRKLAYLNISSLVKFDHEQYFSFFQKYTVYTSHLCVAISRMKQLKTFVWNSYLNQHIINAFYNLKELEVLEAHQKFLYHGTFDHFPYLSCLHTLRIASISEQSITAILKSLPPTMRELSCQYIYLNLETMETYYLFLKRMNKIESIECSHCGITDTKFFGILRSIQNKSQIQSLRFPKNYLGRSRKFRNFSKMLENFKNIKDVCLYGNFIKDRDFCHLIKTICKTAFTQSIRLSLFENHRYSNPFVEFIESFTFIENTFDRSYKWSKSCRNLCHYMDSWQLFHHYVDVLFRQKKQVREYNKALCSIQTKINDRKGYLQLCQYYSSTKTPYHPVFSVDDLQRFIFSFF